MKKYLLGLASTVAVVAPIASTVACGGSNSNGDEMIKSDQSLGTAKLNGIANYQLYIAGDAKTSITSDGFAYKEFDDLPQLKSWIQQNKVAGAISSDYLTAQIAKKGWLQKIDFENALFKPEGLTIAKADWARELQKEYTPEAWKILASFDNYLGDVDGDGTNDKLWEYSIPYFSQTKVIAVNFDKSKLSGQEKAEQLKMSPTDFQKQFAGLNNKQIFEKLKTLGFGHLLVNDYWRDNLMMGSNDQGAFSSKITGQNVDGQPDFKAYTNKFKEATSGVFGDENVQYDTSGGRSLNKLVNPQEKSVDVATLYNGDALDAYLVRGDDTDGTNEGWTPVGTDKDYTSNVRVISPQNPSFMLDTFVVPVTVKGDALSAVYATMYKAVFQGFSKTTDVDKTAVYTNFDSVNYTPAWKNLEDEVNKSYFDIAGTATDKDNKNAWATYISSMVKTSTNNINENHITYPIDEKDLDSAAKDYYDENKN